jgi:hypothetical protein
MANSVASRPIIIDTPGATVLISDVIRVWGIRWVGGTTAGHLAEVRDSNDNVKWSAVATGPNYVESDLIADEKLWNGLKVPTLQSGKLYIVLW